MSEGICIIKLTGFQSSLYTGFSLSRKSNFIVEAIVFFLLLAEKRHNMFINVIINSCDSFYILQKSNSADREREYIGFSSWSARKHFYLCGNFKTYLTSGHCILWRPKARNVVVGWDFI